MAKNVQGSKVLQDLIENGSLIIKNHIFDKLINHILELSMDISGNYSIHKLIEFASKNQQYDIIIIIGNNSQ